MDPEQKVETLLAEAIASTDQESVNTEVAVDDTEAEMETKEETVEVVKKRGAFIVLEGLDRSGKTTQVRLLGQRVVESERDVEMIRFPDRSTAIGKIIDDYLTSKIALPDHSIHLLFTANRWESAARITNLLASGTTVLCDRYYHSGLVYTLAKTNSSLNATWARAPEVGLPRPDCVVFLDLEVETARERGGFGEERYEKEEMQRRVREEFKRLGGEEGADLVVVPADGELEEVSERIWEKVQGIIEKVEAGEFGEEVRTVS